MTLCAAGNNDRIGLLLCTDRVEKFVPPRKGARHALRVIRDLFVFRPEQSGTDLRAGLDFLNRVTRRRVLLFLFSDFLDTGYQKALERTGHRHDVVAVVVSDPRERELPAVGLVEVQDAETGERLVVDTSSRRFRAAFAQRQSERRQAFEQLRAAIASICSRCRRPANTLIHSFASFACASAGCAAREILGRAT